MSSQQSPKDQETQLENRIAITAAIQSVLLAISELKGQDADNEASIQATLATNYWNWYQAKTSRENDFEIGHAILELQILEEVDQPKDHIQKTQERRQFFDAEMQRYQEEKIIIRANAEYLGQQSEILLAKANAYDLANIFLQIGIMLTALSLLGRDWRLWLTSCLLGGIGTVTAMYALGLPSLPDTPPPPEATELEIEAAPWGIKPQN